MDLIDWILRGCLGALYLIAGASALVAATFLVSRAFTWGDE